MVFFSSGAENCVYGADFGGARFLKRHWPCIVLIGRILGQYSLTNVSLTSAAGVELLVAAPGDLDVRRAAGETLRRPHGRNLK